jgi:Cu+-exporting ATPase
MVKRPIIPLISFLAGSALMLGVYLGVLSWLEGWTYAVFQLQRDRLYVVPIIGAFGLQSALYSILRVGLYSRAAPKTTGGAMMGASGGTSTTAMVACCLHHATNLLPVLGVSAAAAFLARYQRPFMQLSLAMNLAGILIMLAALRPARQGTESGI